MERYGYTRLFPSSSVVILIRKQVVPDHSSFFNRREIERNVFLQENHMNMCRFQSQNDPGYKYFRSGLRRYLGEIVPAKEDQKQKGGTDHEVDPQEQAGYGPAGS
jgi:hypothetical protein